MVKKVEVEFPQASHDFYKTNGGDYRVFSEGLSLTRQEFAEECDINAIMARYEKTGALPSNIPGEPFYADFTQIPDDLLSSLKLFDDAERAFMTLPAVVRKEFDNDPHAFVAFASDPLNVAQMRSWGLMKPLPEPAPAAPSPAPSSPPASPAPPAGGSQKSA